MFHCRRFSGAIRAKKAKYFPRLYFERNIVHGTSGTEVLHEIIDRNHARLHLYSNSKTPKLFPDFVPHRPRERVNVQKISLIIQLKVQLNFNSGTQIASWEAVSGRQNQAIYPLNRVADRTLNSS